MQEIVNFIKKYYKAIIITALLVIIYFPTLKWMFERWMAVDSYFGHGPLVPFVSLYLLWQRRKLLKQLQTRPSGLGLVLIAIGLIIHILSAFFRIYFTSGYSILVVLFGIVLYFFGFALLKAIFFPIFFLIFMIPLPLVAIVNIAFRMKLFAAYCATFILNKIGIAAVRDGSLIRMRKAILMVEDPCSGLRSLISLLALGSLIAYLSKLPSMKKIIVVIASVPIAILANIARIVMMCFMSELYGVQFIEGPMHTLSGLFVFVVAFIGLAMLVKYLE